MTDFSNYEPEGREFESLRAHHFPNKNEVFQGAIRRRRILVYLWFTKGRSGTRDCRASEVAPRSTG